MAIAATVAETVAVTVTAKAGVVMAEATAKAAAAVLEVLLLRCIYWGFCRRRCRRRGGRDEEGKGMKR
jgi:hypothetical protein